ncbi:60S ribosomal protein L28-like [Paramacrobiotus metropolitanus]|uniref:60S ribosomal protein L28-like n=1 Tax=Paramacrobiotus metropolitanus TaxID=2943436 RepID=UPI002445D808|nr:60S ribosomal protein L28-like [Paramacrobiotus metropolitanus]
MSADLVWQIIRNNHAFLKRQRGVCKTFSKEPGNLKGINSPRLNGIANRNVFAIQPAAAGTKGLVFTTSRPIGSRKVKQNNRRSNLKRGARPSYRTIRNSLRGAGAPRKIRSLALRRASAILSSQRVKPAEAKTEKSKTKK